jgi:hypothetical protein
VRLLFRHRRQQAVAGADQRFRRQPENLFAQLLPRQGPRWFTPQKKTRFLF